MGCVRATVACSLVLAASAAGATRADVTVHGNLALQTEVYLSVLFVPEDAPPSQALADMLALQAKQFLVESGYELAHVTGTFADGQMALEVNEGLLERIVFRGRLTFNMLRFRLALDLPKQVFNRPALQRQVLELTERFNLDRPRWVLVPTERREHEGPQFDERFTSDLLIQGKPLMMPQQDYELHFVFPEREWNTGPGLDVRSSYFDGLELGLNYQGRSLFASGDRWRVAAMGGAGLRQNLDDNRLYVFPSRALVDLQWYSPPFAKVTRTLLWLRGEGLARQRRDLNLENYYSVAPELSASVQLRPTEGLLLSLGYGVQYFQVLGARGPESGTPPLATDLNPRWRSYFHAGVELTLDDAEGRWDRRHGGHLEARLWSVVNRPDQPNLLEVRGAWQKFFALGWHDVVLRARGIWLQGDVLFPFEEPLGDYLRATFGDVFVRAAGGLRAEFRFSLTRDLFKLGLFTDLAAFGEVDRVTGAQTPRFGAAFGPGFHALIEGMFQMELHLSFGLLSTGRFNTGVHAVLIKIF